MKLTQKRLKELLAYDPETGVFTRRVRQIDDYRRVWIDGRSYHASRLAWFYMTGCWPEGHVDHINSKRSDNRFENLRQVTPSENGRNRGANYNNTCGYKGVTRNGKSSYTAQINHHRRHYYLGSFPTPELAAAAYARAAKKLHGKFARTD